VRSVAYFDDSEIGHGPVYVLAGWVAAAETWRPFAEDWMAVLEMKPRIGYFKFSEAMNGSGEFYGISEESRDEKMRHLLRIIERYALVGISASMCRDVFTQWFGWDRGPLGNPYFMLFYGAIRRLFKYAYSTGAVHPIDFVFDSQPEQMSKVLDGWREFVRSAPVEYAPLVGDPPYFRSDKTTVPLQAADFHAGWLRTMNTAVELNQPLPRPRWMVGGDKIRREYTFMEWWHAQDTFVRLFGFLPVTYSFGWGHPPHFPAMPTSGVSLRR
jgi:hypothetical protein